MADATGGSQIALRNAVNPSAVLPTPPPTLPIWAKAIYYLLESILVGYTIAQYDYGSQVNPVGADPGDITGGSWRKFTFHWENTATTDAGDDQVFTIDLVNITNGNVDGTWTDADYDYCVGLLNTMCVDMLPNIVSYLTLREIRAYIAGFNPYSNPKPFAATGPPERVYPLALTGALTGSFPPQPCTTVTEMTPSRPHWGRFYTPTFGAACYAPGGRLAASVVAALATNAHDTYNNLMSNQFFPVVPTTQSSKAPARTLQTVSGVRVDDVSDVQRRRRYQHAQLIDSQPVVATELEQAG